MTEQVVLLPKSRVSEYVAPPTTLPEEIPAAQIAEENKRFWKQQGPQPEPAASEESDAA